MQNVNYSKPLDLKIFSSFLNSLQLIKKNSTVAVSVSAGVDSMALLHMSDKWAKENNIRLLIIIFNHNIREESLREVSYVRKTAKKLGWRFKTLIWKSPAKKNILEKARIARYTAISNLCKKNKINVLLLGHHQDDLLETFLIRIKKKSRIEGLCPMISCRKVFNIYFVRPFLNNSKKEIYKYAYKNKILFFEDPTNKEKKYFRTQVRNFLEENNELRFNLHKSINLFCKLRKHFDLYVKNYFLKNVVHENEGYISIEKKILTKLPDFLIFKILNKGIMNVGNNKYPLRSKNLESLAYQIKNDKFKSFSVGGCLIIDIKTNIAIVREFNQIKNIKLILNGGQKELWDNKFLISNLAKNLKISITPLGKELEDKNFLKFYSKNSKNNKFLPFKVRKILPVIKTLEGKTYIPHLNISSCIKLKKKIKIENVDFCEVYI